MLTTFKERAQNFTAHDAANGARIVSCVAELADDLSNLLHISNPTVKKIIGGTKNTADKVSNGAETLHQVVELKKHVERLPKILENIQQDLSTMVTFQVNPFLPSPYTLTASQYQLHQAKQSLYTHLYDAVRILTALSEMYNIISSNISATLNNDDNVRLNNFKETLDNFFSVIQDTLSNGLHNIGILNKEDQAPIGNFLRNLTEVDPHLEKTTHKLQQVCLTLESCRNGTGRINVIEDAYVVINSLLLIRNILTGISHWQTRSILNEVKEHHDNALFYARGTASMLNQNIDSHINQLESDIAPAITWAGYFSRYNLSAAIFAPFSGAYNLYEQDTRGTVSRTKDVFMDSVFNKMIQPFLAQLLKSEEWSEESAPERRARIAEWKKQLIGTELEDIIENIVCNLYLNSAQAAAHAVLPPIADAVMTYLAGLALGTNAEFTQENLMCLSLQIASGIMLGRYLLAPSAAMYCTYELHEHIATLRETGEIRNRFRALVDQILNGYYLNAGEEKQLAEDKLSSNAATFIKNSVTGTTLALKYGPVLAGFSDLPKAPKPLSKGHQVAHNVLSPVVELVKFDAGLIYKGGKFLANELVETAKFDARLAKGAYGFVNQHVFQPIGNWLQRFRHQPPAAVVAERSEISQRPQAVAPQQEEKIADVTSLIPAIQAKDWKKAVDILISLKTCDSTLKQTLKEHAQPLTDAFIEKMKTSESRDLINATIVGDNALGVILNATSYEPRFSLRTTRPKHLEQRLLTPHISKIISVLGLGPVEEATASVAMQASQ